MTLQEYLDTLTIDVLRERFLLNPSRTPIKGESLEDWWDSLCPVERMQLMFPYREGLKVSYNGEFYRMADTETQEEKLWKFLKYHMDEFLYSSFFGKYIESSDLKDVLMKNVGEPIMAKAYVAEHMGFIFTRWEWLG